MWCLAGARDVVKTLLQLDAAGAALGSCGPLRSLTKSFLVNAAASLEQLGAGISGMGGDRRFLLVDFTRDFAGRGPGDGRAPDQE